MTAHQKRARHTRYEEGLVLNQPEYRIEGRAKVTGSATYTADVRREGMLDVSYVRSMYPHARIISIDTAAATAMPGVHTVLLGSDVRPFCLGRTLQDWPVLAWDRVRLVGDRIAAVAADTLAEAEAACDMIAVEYEELPGIFSPEAAIAPGAPVLHPDSDGYRFLRGTRHPHSHPNMQGEGNHEHGDVEATFASASQVFEHTFDVARTIHGHLEPHASAVWMEGDRFHVCSTNKSPFRLRDQLAAALEIPAERIVVDSEYIGGDFGGKGFSIDEYVLIILARVTGRPVRYVTRYVDDIRAGNTRHAARFRMRTGVDARGRIVAHSANIVYDGGAYAAGKGNPALMPAGGLSTLVGYHLPAVRVDAMCAYTNNVPGGNARAPGQPQMSFASESHVDLIARSLGTDPLEFRRMNAIQIGDIDCNGERWGDSTFSAVLDLLHREAHWDRPPRAGRGRGMSLGARSSPEGGLTSDLMISVSAEAQIQVLTGVADQGGGAHTMMQRVIAERLGVPLDQIEVRKGATDVALFDLGAGGSRLTPVAGGAALAGADALLKRLELLAPGRPVLAQLELAARSGDIRVKGHFEHEAGLHCTYACSVEVEVDRQTGQVSVIDCVFVADVGTVINPLALRGQLVGGFVSGLGQALMEELNVEDGFVTTPNLGDYKMPSMPDIPPIRIVLLTEHPGGGPFGAKSAGELANVAVAPAVANAVHDAVGVRITSLPITAEKVFAAMTAAESGTAN